MLRPYLEFLLFSVSDELTLPKNAKDVDWEVMLQWAEEQAIVGVIYDGIQKAGKSLNIPFDTLMEWIGYASQIEAQNRVVNDRCIKIVEQFENVGYHCWILKGQGNAMMYPQPLLRTPGDIDVYVLQKEQEEKRVSKAILAVRKNIWRLRRDARLVRYFPSECLWEPVFRVYHFGWRLVH